MQKPSEGPVLPVLAYFKPYRANWGDWAQIGPKYRKSSLGRHSKSFKVFNPSFHIK